MSLFVLLLALAQAPAEAPPPVAATPPAAEPAAKPKAPPAEGAPAVVKPERAEAIAKPVAPKLPPGGEIPVPSLDTLVSPQRPPITPDGQVNRTQSPRGNDMSRLQRQVLADPGPEQGQATLDAMARLSKQAHANQPAEDALPREADSPLPSRPEPEQVRYFARAWFQALISGDARLATSMSAMPFQFEERTVRTPEDLKAEWLKTLRSRRIDLLELYDLEVLTPAEMEKKYGKPPARLSGLHWRDPKTYVVVANLSGHAAVVVFRAAPVGFGWQAVGYHD